MDSTGLQGKRTRCPLRGKQFFELFCTFNTQQPEGFFANIPSGRLEIRAVKQHSSGGKRINEVLHAVTSRIEDPPAVIISETGKRTRRM